MSAERLSRLQKWIIQLLFLKSDDQCLLRKTVFFYYWTEYLGQDWFFHITQAGVKAQVTLTKSIKNLYFKGYIDCAGGKISPILDLTHTGVNTPLPVAKNIKMFFLTEKGIAEAKKLLKIKKERLNFKRPAKFR